MVTGDTGFKGSWLSLWLRELGAEVLGFALAPESESGHFSLLKLNEEITHVTGDIRNYASLYQCAAEYGPEFVFHLAAQALVRRSYDDPRLTFETNIGGSMNIAELVRNLPSARVLIYVTSDKCYRNKEWIWGYRENDELGGHDPYSASKAAAEMVFSSYLDSYFRARGDFGAASVRAGNVVGGGDWSDDRIVPDCMRSLHRGQPIRLRNPAATRPWQHVLDPLHGYLHLASRLYDEPQTYAGSWNFGPSGDSERTVRDVAEGLVNGVGYGAIEGAVETDAPHEAGLLRLNCDKARSLLGWTPRWNFDRSISETARWYREVWGGESAGVLSRKQIAEFLEA